MSDIHSDRILILDFGSQYTQLIARRVREAGVYCEIYSWDNDADTIKAFAPTGIILSGGPESVNMDEPPRADQIVFELGIPVLGICYGMQTMAAQLGGEVENADHHEYGYAQVRARGHSQLLKDIEDHTTEEGYGLLDVWMSHGDRVNKIPAGFKIIASTDNAPIAGMADDERRFYGVQFHPEVTHTRQGERIVNRFVHDICGCSALWTPDNIIESSIAQIKNQVGKDEVILGLSGGVDSSVVAALLHKAIDKQLTCIFVDNGLLRLHEGDQVMATFAQHMGIKVIRVNAEERFLSALKGVSEPEKKRKIIGNMFIDVFEEEAAKLKNAMWLAQGTIYPDVIESAGSKTGKAHVIKSHHNVGGLPDDMKLKLVSRCANYSRTKYVRSVPNWVYLTTWFIVIHFPGLVWACVFWVRLKRNMRISCVRPMPFLLKNCTRMICITRSVRLLLFLFRSSQWGLSVMRVVMTMLWRYVLLKPSIL